METVIEKREIYTATLSHSDIEELILEKVKGTFSLEGVERFEKVEVVFKVTKNKNKVSNIVNAVVILTNPNRITCEGE